MVARSVAALLGLGLFAGLVPTDLAAQVKPVEPKPAPPVWLNSAARATAANINGVKTAQGMSRETSYFMLVRGTRPCSEAQQLWDEIKAATAVDFLFGQPECWPLPVQPGATLPSPMRSLLNFTVNNVADPATDLPVIAEQARTVEGWTVVEMWANVDTVLAVYRLAGSRCHEETFATQLDTLIVRVGRQGISPTIQNRYRPCYGSWNPHFQQQALLYAHLRQVGGAPGAP